MNATEENLLKIKDVGPVATKNIVNFINDNRNIKIINELNNLGVWPKPILFSENSNLFENKTFVITGTLSKPREDYKKLIEELGGKVSSSVSKKTTYLLCGEESGSKLEDAKNNNVSILNENEFLNLIQNNNNNNKKMKP